MRIEARHCHAQPKNLHDAINELTAKFHTDFVSRLIERILGQNTKAKLTKGTKSNMMGPSGFSLRKSHAKRDNTR